MNPAAISFDLDGTLVDTAGEIAEAVNRTLADYDVPARPLAEITHMIGNGLHDLMIRLLARLFIEHSELADRIRPDEALVRLDQHYAETVGTMARPYPGAVEALQQLAQAGVRCACVTNKEGRHARRVLECSGLAPLIELLVAGDTLPVKKPHRDVLRQVAQHFQVGTDRFVHVGDSRVDVEAARNAGVAAWAVPYGYNAGEPVVLARPDRMFDDLLEVAVHVRGLKTAPGAVAN